MILNVVTGEQPVQIDVPEFLLYILELSKLEG